MSVVRRKLFEEGSNSWTSDQTIAERPNNEAVENERTEIVEYTVVNEGDVALKEPSVETPNGLKTPQENMFRPTTTSCFEKVNIWLKFVTTYFSLFESLFSRSFNSMSNFQRNFEQIVIRKLFLQEKITWSFKQSIPWNIRAGLKNLF